MTSNDFRRAGKIIQVRANYHFSRFSYTEISLGGGSLGTEVPELTEVIV